MPDHRSRRQKLEAVLAPNSGASEGERVNARSILAKMQAGSTANPQARQMATCKHGTRIVEGGPRCVLCDRESSYAPPTGSDTFRRGPRARPFYDGPLWRDNYTSTDDILHEMSRRFSIDLNELRRRFSLDD